MCDANFEQDKNQLNDADQILSSRSHEASADEADIVQFENFDPVIDEVDPVNGSFSNRAVNISKMIFVAAEINPFTNAPLRYGVFFGGTFAATRNIALSAGMLAFSTASLEGGAAVLTAEILTKNEKNKYSESIIEKINSIRHSSAVTKYLPSERKIGPALTAFLGGTLGTSILLGIKKSENLDINQQQLRRIGFAVTAWSTSYSVVQASLVAEGLTNIADPRIAIPIFGTLSALFAGFSKIKNYYERNSIRVSENGNV